MIRTRSEEGSSLIEILVAIAILGVAVTAMLAALATGIDLSSVDRAHAQAESVMRSYAEAVQAAPYRNCPASYGLDDVAFTDVSGDGVTVQPIAAGDVTYLVTTYPTGTNPVVFSPAVASSCPPPLAQRIKLRVTSSDARVGQVELEIIKRAGAL